jgi:hypothetical protein
LQARIFCLNINVCFIVTYATNYTLTYFLPVFDAVFKYCISDWFCSGNQMTFCASYTDFSGLFNYFSTCLTNAVSATGPIPGNITYPPTDGSLDPVGPIARVSYSFSLYL